MNKIIFIIALMVGGILNYTNAVSDPLDSKLQADMGQALDKYHLGGISVSYKLAGAEIKTLSVGYSDVQNKVPVNPSTYFEFASITKAFVSTLIMQQVALGKIDLDEKLLDIEKKYPGKNNQLANLVELYPHLGTITLKQYLTHTSGIPEAMNLPAFWEGFNKNPMAYYTSEELITMAMKHKPFFQPGEKNHYGYTNTDYHIVGLILAAVTGNTVAENIKQLSTNLNLTNIYYPGPRATDMPTSVRMNMTHAYLTQYDARYNFNAFAKSPIVKFPNGTIAKDITNISINDVSNGPAAGGLISQTAIMVKWYWLLFHKKVISQPVLKQMLQGVHTAAPNKKYGFAIVIEKNKKYGVIYSHSGNDLGARANLIFVPKLNLVLCIAVNSDIDEDISGITDKLIADITRAAH
jgi:D-alanyl-D-alanine carboxypeptidase